MGPVSKTLKIMWTSRGMTQKALFEKYNEITGSTFSRQSFSLKLKKDAIKVTEFQTMCDILGYELVITEKTNGEDGV